MCTCNLDLHSEASHEEMLMWLRGMQIKVFQNNPLSTTGSSNTKTRPDSKRRTLLSEVLSYGSLNEYSLN